MPLELDLRPPVAQSIGSMDRSRAWSDGLVAVDGLPLGEPARHQDSFLSECECPDDCLRDHQNE